MLSDMPIEKLKEHFILDSSYKSKQASIQKTNVTKTVCQLSKDTDYSKTNKTRK